MQNARSMKQSSRCRADREGCQLINSEGLARRDGCRRRCARKEQQYGTHPPQRSPPAALKGPVIVIFGSVRLARVICDSGSSRRGRHYCCRRVAGATVVTTTVSLASSISTCFCKPVLAAGAR